MATKAVRNVSPWSLGSGVRLRELIKVPAPLMILWLLLTSTVGAIILAIRYWVVTLTLAAAVAGAVQWFPYGAVVAVVVPATYWTCRILLVLNTSEVTTIKMVLIGMWRIRQINQMWQPVLYQLKITSRGDGESVPPLHAAKPTDSGVVGEIVTGAIALDSVKLTKLEGNLASGFFVDRVTVRPTTPSRATIRFEWGQHLRSVFKLHDLPAVQQPKNLPARIRFGVRSDGRPATLISNLSVLIGGVAGSGKSSTMWALLAGYLEGVPTRVRIVDPSGIEFAEAKKHLGNGIIHDYVSDPKQPGARKLEDFWESLEEDFNRRMASVERSGNRLHVPTEAEPLDVLVIDEILPIAAELKKDSTDHIVGRICYMGRKAGFVVIAASQAGQVDALGRIRDLFPQRLCHRTESRNLTEAFLGDSAEADGARCSNLDPIADMGVLYMAAQGQAGYLPCRAAWVSDVETGTIAQGDRPSPPTSAAELKVKPTALYRLWDVHNNVIYVGIAEKGRLEARWEEHERTKTWWKHVARPEEVHVYPNRDLALTAEALMIRQLRPKYNKQHNR